MKEKGRKLLVILLISIAVICAGYLIWYYATAYMAEKAYQKEKDKMVIEIPEQEPETEEESVQIPIDFSSLQEKNPDIYAWIRIDGTTIDYPVLQRENDDEYYLNHSWEGKIAAEGAIFTQAYNDKAFTDFNTVIYGHRMGEGVETMFHQLGNYLDPDYLDQHREVVIYTPEHILTYKVFAAVVYSDRHLMLYYDYEDEAERQAFIDSIFNSRDMRNQYCDDVDVTTDDRIITLSTCINGEPEHRLLVEAVLTDEK